MAENGIAKGPGFDVLQAQLMDLLDAIHERFHTQLTQSAP